MLRRFATLTATGLLALAGGACADTAQDATPGVVAAFYPLQFIAERVGGEHTTVTGLAPPGVEAHDLELTPSQVAEVAEADLVVYLPGFQPAVDEAVAAQAGDRAFDVTNAVSLLAAAEDGHDHEDEGEAEEHADENEEHEDEEHAETDPHVWLDPDRMATMAGALAAELGAADPDHADDYTAAAETLATELAALDTELAEGLADCQRQEIVVSHAAFGYLADRYQLRQIAITGLSPEDEPTPQQLDDARQEAEEVGATTIFFEVLVSPDIAETVADAVGAETAVLDPIEGLAPDSDEDYLSLMRQNMHTLRPALGCT